MSKVGLKSLSPLTVLLNRTHSFHRFWVRRIGSSSQQRSKEEKYDLCYNIYLTMANARYATSWCSLSVCTRSFSFSWRKTTLKVTLTFLALRICRREMTSKLSSATDLLLPGFKEQGCASKTPQQDGRWAVSSTTNTFDAFLIFKKKKNLEKKRKTLWKHSSISPLKVKTLYWSR